MLTNSINRKFFCQGIIFIALGMILLAGLECTARSLFRETEHSSEGISRPEEEINIYKNPELLPLLDKENFEIITLGNSHMRESINSQFFSKKAICLALESQDLYYSHRVFEFFKPHLNFARYLILNVSYFSFGFQLKSADAYMTERYTQFGIPPEGNVNMIFPGSEKKSNAKVGLKEKIEYESIDGTLNDFFKRSYLFRYRVVFLKKIFSQFSGTFFKSKQLNFEENSPGNIVAAAKKEQPKKSLRDIVHELVASLHPSTAKERASFHMDGIYDSKNESLEKYYLKSILNKALFCGMKVFILEPPVRSDYYSLLRPSYIQNYRKNMKEILSDYEGNPDIYFEDFSQDKRFQEGDFRDPDHLNLIGAEKFTKIIDEKVKKIWLI